MLENKLNVYILTYNRAEYLKYSIDSVLAQNYKDFNLYVLDNCSEDDTESLVKSYTDPRLHYIRHEKNIRAIGNHNYAVDHNDAEYFMIFHDDDTMNPEMLGTEVAFLDAHPDVSIVSSISAHIDANGDPCDGYRSATEIMMEKQDLDKIVLGGGDFIRRYLEEDINIIFPSVMYRGSFMKSKGLRFIGEAGPSGDTEMMFRIERNGGKLAILNKPLMNSRMHGDQDSFVSFGIMYEQLFAYLRKDAYYAELLERNKAGCHAMYRRLSRIIARNHVLGSFDHAQAKENEQKVWGALGGKRSDRFKYRAVTIAYRCMPRLVRKKTESHLAGRM